jgi:hypothetical protein
MTKPDSSELPFDLVATGDGSYEMPGGLYVIRDQTELEAFWKRLHERQRPPPSAPSVFWPDALVLFVLLGTRPTGGYMLQVERVSRTSDGVLVHALELTPGPRAFTTQALEAPYQAVTVSRFEGTAELSMRSETHDP